MGVRRFHADGQPMQTGHAIGSRQKDFDRAEQDEARRAALRDHSDQQRAETPEGLPGVPHEGVEQVLEGERAFIEDYSSDAEPLPSGAQVAHAAIGQALAWANAKIERARITETLPPSLRPTNEPWQEPAPTPAQLQAKAFVDELEARGSTIGNTYFHSDDDDDEEMPDFEAEVDRELEAANGDQYVGLDGLGRAKFWDAQKNEEYVLVEE